MSDLERVIKGLEQFKADFKPFCGNGSDWARVDDAINLLKEQEAVVRCKDCVHWIPGKITDKDDFIQPRCERNGGGWLSDDYCSCAERREEACTSNCTN